MAALPPIPSSRRTREPAQSETVVGNFRIQIEIGKGSFATVYRAVHVKNRSLVAIKSVHLAKLNRKLKENLYSEIDILKGLHHPHIVALIDCQESSAHIHLVMEFCSLGDLSYFIKKRDRLTLNPLASDMMRKYPSPPVGGLNEVIVRHFLKQLSSALEFLRARNFIHRDVKPQNLLLNPSPIHMAKQQGDLPYAASENSLVPVVGVESLPMLKIADFGFARSLPSTSLAETLCGSPLYMAPEILRYEKYDAKADLWSVGTVLYEMMVGKPPFRASNHVELLRKIERGDDKILFPETSPASDDMKRLIRGLLKRNPVERMGFKDFFSHSVIEDEIPGLIEDDVKGELKDSVTERDRPTTGRRQSSFARDPKPAGSNREGRETVPESSSLPSREASYRTTSDGASNNSRQRSDTSPRLPSGTRRHSNTPSSRPDAQEQVQRTRRPSIHSHTTAPARHDLHYDRQPVSNVAALDHHSYRNSSLAQQHRERDRDTPSGNELSVKEEAEQEVAFERDYVVVEKRAVEVNAFADELAASPRLHGGQIGRPDAQIAMTRRATTQGQPTSITGAHVTPSRAMQIAAGKQLPDAYHKRQGSYERRHGASPGSATSAISKALNMANFRLFGIGFSPPLLGKAGQSPPQAYGAYPAYPTSHGSLIMARDGRTSLPQDEDTRAVLAVEEAATRSDVVYGFAEVKYKQLIPLAPSINQGLGLRAIEDEQVEGEGDDGLTVDAIVTLSEEALVLYVKALSLLARSMDIASAWWSKKSRGEVLGENSSVKAEPSTAAGTRVNNVVQWVRSRFNEVLEKAEFVSLKLIDAQKRLPLDHPSHPNNHPSASSSATRLGSSADAVVVSSGITAEKLIYDRALEMSRAAAVNELVGEDLPGCEIAYVTAVRMLEAILDEDDLPPKKGSSGKEGHETMADVHLNVNGMEAEDRRVVEKLVGSMRGRLAALRKKMTLLSKRQSPPPQSLPSPRASPRGSAGTTPTIATTPPLK